LGGVINNENYTYLRQFKKTSLLECVTCKRKHNLYLIADYINVIHALLISNSSSRTDLKNAVTKTALILPKQTEFYSNSVGTTTVDVKFGK